MKQRVGIPMNTPIGYESMEVIVDSVRRNAVGLSKVL